MSVRDDRASWPSRVVLAALAVAALVFEAMSGARIWRTVGEQFPGFILYGGLAVGQLNQPYWTGVQAGLHPGDVILAVDGEDIPSLGWLLARVRNAPPGTPFLYTIARPDRTFTRPIASMTFTVSDFLISFGVLTLTATVLVLGGTAIAWFRSDAMGYGIYAFGLIIAVNLGGAVKLAWSDWFTSVELIAIPLRIAALVHLALVFPEPLAPLRRSGAYALLPYLAVTPLIAWNLMVSSADPQSFAAVDWWNRWLTFAAAFGLPLAILSARWRPGSEAAARRARVTLSGALLAICCYAVGFVATAWGWMPPAPNSTFVLPAWIWLITLAIASARQDVFDLGTVARARLAAGAVFAIMVFLYLLLLGTTATLFRETLGTPGVWILIAMFLLVAVLLYEPLRRLARVAVGWERSSPVASRSRALRELNADLASSLDPVAIEAVVAEMPARLGLSSVRLFLDDRNIGGASRLRPEHVLVGALDSRRSVLSLGTDRDLGSAAESQEWRRALNSLGLSLALPLRSRGPCLGFLGCGAPIGGGLFSAEDLAALSTLSNHVAVALENVQALERIRELERKLRAENVVLKEELLTNPGIGGLVGRSPAMKRLSGWIEHVAPTDATVLLRGETGTGKELVARAVHAASQRRDRPMIRVNCAAVPSELLETEFFGHERGAFTGAVARKIGRFELADGGTIFLDEIGDLPAELQPKLLRVLQERCFERVGGSVGVQVDVRVIAATNRDLELLVRQGRFREDLFYRLNVLPIVVPPLRERREDIRPLVAHFLQHHAAKMQKPVRGVEERSLLALEGYRWPGNVRELENVIERAMVLCSGENLVVREIEAPDLDERARGSSRPLAEQLRAVKVETICRALSRTSGNQSRAAELLGLKPSSLSRMIKTLGISDDEWRRLESGGSSGPRASSAANPGQ